ncbi:protein kinase, partial [Achlya hypogyna]
PPRDYDAGPCAHYSRGPDAHRNLHVQLEPYELPTDQHQQHVVDAGVIVGCIVASTVAAIAGLVFWCKRRKSANQDLYYLGDNTQAKAGSPFAPSDAECTVDVDMAPLTVYRLERSDFSTKGHKLLASGAYGNVWLCQYGTEAVAVKRIKHDSAAHIQKFIDEILLLARMDCPHIVAFIGVVWRRPTDLACVVEYMDRGDLRTLLASSSPADFSWSLKLESIRSVAQGLIYLHTFETPIIHRDLKSRNVLLDSTKGTKLTDFGESREMDDSTLTSGIGTYQWMAPEVILGHAYSVAADVYSFGVLLTELSTHGVPYADLKNPSTGAAYNQQYLITQVTAGSLRPTLDRSHTPSWVVDLATACLAHDPDDRPSMLKVATALPKTTYEI